MLVYFLDDDELELALWELRLSQSKPDWEHKCFTCAEKFIEEVRQRMPDCAVIDLVMPYADGVGVCKTIQKHYPNIKTFINTSMAGDEYQVLADRCSATYMNKNTNFEERLKVMCNGFDQS